MSKERLVKVMIEPRNSIYNQFREILKDEGVELIIEHEVFRQIAEMAFEYKVVARGLREIVEEALMPVLYQVPGQPQTRKVVFKSLFEEPSLIAASWPERFINCRVSSLVAVAFSLSWQQVLAGIVAGSGRRA